MCLYHILYIIYYNVVNSAGVKNMVNTPGRSFKWCNHITYIHMQCKLLTSETIARQMLEALWGESVSFLFIFNQS